jgi:hypothetical protein
MKNDDLAARIRARFANEASEPDPELWTKIAVQLADDRRKRKRRILWIWWWFGVAVVLAGLWWLWQPRKAIALKKDPIAIVPAHQPSITQRQRSLQVDSLLASTPSTPLAPKANKVNQESTIARQSTQSLEQETASSAKPSLYAMTKTTRLAQNSHPIAVLSVLDSVVHNLWALPFLPTRMGQLLDSAVVQLLPIRIVLLTDSAASKVRPRRSLPIWVSLAPTWNYVDLESNRQDAVLLDKIVTVAPLATQRMGLRLQAGVSVPLGARLDLQLAALYQYTPLRIQLETRQWLPDSIEVTAASATTFVIAPHLKTKQLQINESLQQLGLSMGLERSFVLGRNWTTGLQLGTAYFQTVAMTVPRQARQQLQGFSGFFVQRQFETHWAFRLAPYLQLPIWQHNGVENGLFTVKSAQWGLQIGLIRF